MKMTRITCYVHNKYRHTLKNILNFINYLKFDCINHKKNKDAIIINVVKRLSFTLKIVKSRFENKTNLSSQEYLNYLDNWAKPST